MRYERPSHRRHHRVTAPLDVTIDGEACKTADWSLGGFCVAGAARRPTPGDVLSCRITVPFQGFRISFDVQAEVVRVGPREGSFGCRFIALNDRHKELLQHFVNDLVTGHMAPVGDTIQRIDVPVTPVRIDSDPNPPGALPLRRWRVKAVAMSGVYLLAGLLVFGYLGVLVYGHVLRLEVSSAVVTAPVVPLTAPADGHFVPAAAAAPGSAFAAGQVLGSVEDATLEEQIGLAQVERDRARDAHQRMAALLETERQRADNYLHISRNNYTRALARLAGANGEWQAARTEEGRLRTMVAGGVAPQRQLDEAVARTAALDANRQVAEADVEQNHTLLQAAERGLYFDGQKFEDRLSERAADEELARQAIRSAEDAILVLMQRREHLAIRAPAEGRLLDLLMPGGGTARRGEAVALFERTEAPIIEAALTGDEALSVGVGDEASLYFPTLGRRGSARVESVDLTSGFIDLTRTGTGARAAYTWHDAEDRTAKVVLRVLEGADRAAAALPPGTPVVISFPRRWTSEVMDRVWSVATGWL